MGSLLIITGPPGSGKSTVSRLLADGMERSVLVEGDLFFAFLAAGAIPPWLPASMEQNHVVGDAAAAATRRFMADYDTVYDGIMGPWQLDRFVRALGTNAVDYVILLPAFDVCVERVTTRADHNFTDLDATRHMHEQFADAVTTGTVRGRHVVDSGMADSAALVEHIGRRRSAGDFRLD